MYTVDRPNRIDEAKNEDYHLRWAKYAIGSYDRGFHYYLVNKYLVNAAFYKGNQWIFDEDLGAFFMDETGDVRNRIKVVHNIVKPYVEYLRGSVVRMDINFEVASVSRQAINRRDSALNNLLVQHKAARRTTQSTAAYLKAKYQLGDTETETIDSFNNLYIDRFARNMKHLVDFIANYENDMEQVKNSLAEDLALGGIAVAKEDDRNGKQVFDKLDIARFGFDLSARKPDLSDAEYFLDFDLVSAVDIFEEFPNLSREERSEIDKIRLSSVPGMHNTTDFYFGSDTYKVPKYCVYWKDIETRRHAAVLDAFGKPRLVDMDEGKYEESSIIKEADLAQYKEGNDWIDKTLLGKSERKIPIDVVRFCKFIPAIYCDSVQGDIVLDYGIRPYSQLYSFGKKKLDFPYKVFTYAYIDGEIISPVDALISPQRYMNRVLSVAESQINNSRGSGYFIDGDSIQDGDGMEGVQRNMNQSKPVVLYAQRNMNNAVIPYDNTVKSGTLTMFNIASQIKSMADDTTGGSAIKGEGGAYRVSVGALEQNLNQGTVLQESYYYALTKIIFKCYDSMMNRGRRIYIANGREIAIVIGDDEFVSFQLTKDYEAEEFKLKAVRAASSAEQTQAANSLLMLMLDKKMIDAKTYAKYYNNSDMAAVAFAVREYQTILEEQMKIVKKQQEEQKQKALIAGAGEMALQNLEEEKNTSLGIQTENANNATKVVKQMQE